MSRQYGSSSEYSEGLMGVSNFLNKDIFFKVNHFFILKQKSACKLKHENENRFKRKDA